MAQTLYDDVLRVENTYRKLALRKLPSWDKGDVVLMNWFDWWYTRSSTVRRVMDGKDTFNGLLAEAIKRPEIDPDLEECIGKYYGSWPIKTFGEGVPRGLAVGGAAGGVLAIAVSTSEVGRRDFRESRRDFLKGLGYSVGGLTLLGGLNAIVSVSNINNIQEDAAQRAHYLQQVYDRIFPVPNQNL
ncbi:MAG: twin-arginine translocation signal domain-containing protein [Nanoarchaeota archaeon]